jgi:fatty-acyl-CoA synthase
MSFVDALGETRGAGTHLSVWDGDGFAELSWDDWRARVERSAAAARALGVRRGHRVACVLTNAPSACTSVVGLFAAGGCVVSLPTIARGQRVEDYLATLRRICATVEPEVVLAERRYADQLASAEALDVPIAAFESLDGAGAIDPDPPVGDELAFVQYSSGSTSTPKGCLLSADAIAAQLDMLAARLDLEGPAEQGVSWLPLSHDMGFFGCLMLSFAKGMRLLVSTPRRFVRAPRTWFEDCARVGATITAGPNSGLDLAARAAAVAPPPPLAVRKLVLGGERVELRTLEAAIDALGPAGLDWRDLLPAYGLAEAVLAVTMPRVADAPRVVHVRSEAVLHGELELVEDGASEGATAYVGLGPPVGDAVVRVDGDAIAEIYVESPSLASGYAGQPELTAERFTERGVRTGDLGFVSGGELFVVGRIDDMLTLGGLNVHSAEIEAELDLVPGVRRGTAVLVELPDGPRHRLVVLAEPDGEPADFDDIAAALRLATARASGLQPEECVFVSAGAVPKTPSGKVQRHHCRRLAAQADGPLLARVTF